MVNAFAYWQGQQVSNATVTYLDDLQQAFGHIQELAGSVDAVEIWNGESGWPTDGEHESVPSSDGTTDAQQGGTDYGSAKAGTTNAQTFFSKAVCAALDWGFNVFYFEAFDEPWKPASKGLDGSSADETHWGAFNSDRSAKFPLTC